jgi:hypothetical protein
MLCQSALAVEAWKFLQMARFLVDRCHTSFTKPTTQTEKTRPSLGRVSSATATAISNIRMLEPQAQKQTTHRAACRKRSDRTSIGRPSSNLWRDASLAPSCEDYVNVVPVLRADHLRGLNLKRRTVSAPTTVADLIRDLAALHHRFVRGRVVGSAFCHIE